MIDPYKAILAYFQSDSTLVDLVNGRIALKHKFSKDAWPTPSKALTIAATTGYEQDKYQSRIRFEAHCFGASQVEASTVGNRVIQLCDDFVRTASTTADGDALIYWIVTDDSPQFAFDQDIKIDFIRLQLRAAVAKTSIGD